MRDHRFWAIECNQPEAAALAARAHLRGVEACDRRAWNALGEAAERGRLAAARRAGDEQVPFQRGL
jgi:hypothetical protein